MKKSEVNPHLRAAIMDRFFFVVRTCERTNLYPKLGTRGGFMIRNCSRVAIVLCYLAFAGGPTRMAEAKSYVAYISDSPASASTYWVAQDAGILKKHGLDVDLIFINGSTRGIQSLIAGDVSFSSGVGTAVINGKLAGGDIAIINSLTNTLPYYVFGKPEIKSPEDLKGRPAAMHRQGRRISSICASWTS